MHRPTLALAFILLLPILLLTSATPISADQGGSAEKLATRSFTLENADVKDVMTVLRAIVGVRSIAAEEPRNTITLRDTPEKLDLAAELIADADRPLGEIVLDVTALQMSTARLHELLASRSQNGPLRLSPSELEGLLGAPATRPLRTFQLSSVGDRAIELALGERIPIGRGTDGGVSYQDVGLHLEVRPRLHPVSREVTLQIRLEVSQPNDEEAPTPRVRTSLVETSARLTDRESLLLIGVVPDGGGPFAPELEGGDAEVVLALRPTIVRSPPEATDGPARGASSGR